MNFRLETGEAVTIVSFDPSARQAHLEEQEDRSLNLALRRRKIKSEIMRLPLSPPRDQLEVLQELLSSFGRRPLIILAREFWHHAEQVQAIGALVSAAEIALVVTIAAEPSEREQLERNFAKMLSCEPPYLFAVADDSSATISKLADRLTKY